MGLEREARSFTGEKKSDRVIGRAVWDIPVGRDRVGKVGIVGKAERWKFGGTATSAIATPSHQTLAATALGKGFAYIR